VGEANQYLSSALSGALEKTKKSKKLACQGYFVRMSFLQKAL
jgi:hypothetical protein